MLKLTLASAFALGSIAGFAVVVLPERGEVGVTPLAAKPQAPQAAPNGPRQPGGGPRVVFSNGQGFALAPQGPGYVGSGTFDGAPAAATLVIMPPGPFIPGGYWFYSLSIGANGDGGGGAQAPLAGFARPLAVPGAAAVKTGPNSHRRVEFWVFEN